MYDTNQSVANYSLRIHKQNVACGISKNKTKNKFGDNYSCPLLCSFEGIHDLRHLHHDLPMGTGPSDVAVTD